MLLSDCSTDLSVCFLDCNFYASSPQAMCGGGYYVVTMSCCPDVCPVSMLAFFGRHCTTDKEHDTTEISDQRQTTLLAVSSGWQVHYTHAAAEASYDHAQSLTL